MDIKTPYQDFNGNDLYVGDFIVHPSGERGQIVLFPDGETDAAKWLVDYDGWPFSRLCLQIGDKGQAVKVITECGRNGH